MSFTIRFSWLYTQHGNVGTVSAVNCVVGGFFVK